MPRTTISQSTIERTEELLLDASSQRTPAGQGIRLRQAVDALRADLGLSSSSCDEFRENARRALGMHPTPLCPGPTLPDGFVDQDPDGLA